MNTEIILTGTELLLGETIDTNSAMIAKHLHQIGLDVYYKTTVGDNQGRIQEVLEIALKRVDFIIVSGGLGPTVDDVTREAVAAAVGRNLVYSQELEKQIAARFAGLGREMQGNNKRQAWLPEGAIPIENPVGTAPCFIAETERGAIICLPGVPRELEHQLINAIIPYLKQKITIPQMLKTRTVRTCGLGESDIDRRLDDLLRLDNPSLGLAAHVGAVDIRIAAKATHEAEADDLIAPIEAQIRERLGGAVFGVDEDTLAGVVGRLLQENHLGLIIADTRTQGALTDAFEGAKMGYVILNKYLFQSPEEITPAFNVDQESLVSLGAELARQVATQLSEENALGMSIIGPLQTASGEKKTALAVAYGDEVLFEEHPYYYEDKVDKERLTTYSLNLIRRWFKKRS